MGCIPVLLKDRYPKLFDDDVLDWSIFAVEIEMKDQNLEEDFDGDSSRTVCRDDNAKFK